MSKRRGKGEGSISYREDRKIWQGVVTIGYDGTGKRKRRVVYGKTRKEVQDKLTRLQGQKLDGTLVDLCKLRLSEYLAHWLENTARRTVRQSTYASYEAIVRRHVNPHIGGIRLTQIASSHVEGLFRRLDELAVTPQRQQKVYAVLRRALNLAVKRDLVPRNVVLSVENPQHEQREMQPLTQHEARRFLKATQADRLNAIYVLAVTVGMRQGETDCVGMG